MLSYSPQCECILSYSPQCECIPILLTLSVSAHYHIHVRKTQLPIA
uniref:Uncharacterized protein n=1 Tax=Anguilla anguilla TaxID=7936 RepID=A0A0E9TA53_ANGAN